VCETVTESLHQPLAWCLLILSVVSVTKTFVSQRNATDPNRYFNRNCNLLKEEKARKKISKELPKVCVVQRKTLMCFPFLQGGDGLDTGPWFLLSFPFTLLSLQSSQVISTLSFILFQTIQILSFLCIFYFCLHKAFFSHSIHVFRPFTSHLKCSHNTLSSSILSLYAPSLM